MTWCVGCAPPLSAIGSGLVATALAGEGKEVSPGAQAQGSLAAARRTSRRRPRRRPLDQLIDVLIDVAGLARPSTLRW